MPQKISHKKTQFYLDKLSALQDGKIVGVAYDPSDPHMDPIVGLRIMMPGGKEAILWILRDDEGNGPGSFDIQK